MAVRRNVDVYHDIIFQTHLSFVNHRWSVRRPDVRIWTSDEMAIQIKKNNPWNNRPTEDSFQALNDPRYSFLFQPHPSIIPFYSVNRSMDTTPPSNSTRGRRKRPAYTSLSTVLTYAAVAYTTYQFVSWAWNHVPKERLEKDEEEEDEEYEEDEYEEVTVDEMESVGRSVRFDEGHSPSRPAAASTTTTPVVTPPLMTPALWRLRRQRMERCREETSRALEGFFSTVRRIIEEQTDTSNETKELRKIRAERDQDVDGTIRQQEKQLWETIKVRSITRMVATAYAHTILFLVLTVQVNLLGGRLFEQQISVKSKKLGEASGTEDYQSSHRLVLTNTYEYFFERGLVSLIKTVEGKVAEALPDWDVMDPSCLHMTKEQFSAGIQRVRVSIEDDGGHATDSRSRRAQTRCLLRFVMPPSHTMELQKVQDILARDILDETWDLLESPVFKDSQSDSINTTFDVLRDQFWAKLFEAIEYTDQTDSRFTTKPLATVLTRLKKTSSSFFESPEDGIGGGTLSDASPFGSSSKPVNMYCSAMEQLPSVLELADVSFG